MAEREPRRGRPRDPAVDEAILAAAVELLADAGFARLTMEQVAARAGVGKASVYLRWPNKVTLLAEAIQHRAGVVPDVPDTGSLPGDMRTFLRALLRTFDAASRAMAAVSGEVDRHPGLRARDRRARRRARRAAGGQRCRAAVDAARDPPAELAAGARAEPRRRGRRTDRQPVLHAGLKELPMFAAIARFDIRFRWLIVAVWLVGVVAGGRLLPGLTSVTYASNGQFLPSSSPSEQATRLAAPFPVVDPNQTATIVASRASGQLTAADAAAISQIEQAVRQVPGVASVRDVGTSPDGRAARAVVTVPGSVSSSNAAATDA